MVHGNSELLRIDWFEQISAALQIYYCRLYVYSCLYECRGKSPCTNGLQLFWTLWMYEVVLMCQIASLSFVKCMRKAIRIGLAILLFCVACILRHEAVFDFSSGLSSTVSVVKHFRLGSFPCFAKTVPQIKQLVICYCVLRKTKVLMLVLNRFHSRRDK